MQRVREFWIAFRNFAIIFSFIMNFVLALVLIFVVYLIFNIKNGIAEPLIDGLHSNFVGLNEARIQTNIPVDDTIPINFTLPVEDTIPIDFTLSVQDTIPINFDLVVQDTTVVTLSQAAVIDDVPAVFTITGGGGTITGSVDITLPAGTPLTIDLSLLVPVSQDIPININVPVRQDIPVNLDVDVQQDIPININVPVDIALNETQLSEPFTNLRNLFEPYVRALDNLPGGWNEIWPFVGRVRRGEVDLLRETDGSRNAWPGFSVTPAGPVAPSPEATEDTTDTAPPDTTEADGAATSEPEDTNAEATEPSAAPEASATPAPVDGTPPPSSGSGGPTPTVTPFPSSP